MIGERLPGHHVQALLSDVRRANVGLKARQRTSAKSGQMQYEVQSGATWDVVETISFEGYREVTVTMTTERDWPLAVPIYDLFFNGTGSGNRPSINATGGYSWMSGGNEAYVYNFRADTSQLTDSKKMVWKFNLMCFGNVTYRIKVRARSSSPGTIAVSVVNA